MNNPHVIPMRKRFAFATAILFVVAIIMVTDTFNTVILPSTAVVAQTQPINTISSSRGTNSSSSSNPLTLNSIFKQVDNSVVQITSKAPTTSNSSNQSSSNVTTLGSGFVYDKQGHIVTNGHVVGDAKAVDVTFPDGNRYTAKVLASDIYSDIAILQISQNSSQPQRQLSSYLKPIVLANSSNLEVGDTVIAIGNPFGLSDAMTTGIVSGIGRSIPISVGGFSIPNAIQTDAAVNPGNSGGPLLNTRGELIGMNTAILSGKNPFSGIGFAIPSNTITKIVPILLEKGYYPHPYLGLIFATLTSDLAHDNGIPLNLKGVYVDRITENGPADKAGIHGSTTDQYLKKHLGDIIMAVDGHNITKRDDLINYVGQHKIAGNNITLTVYRNGHPMDLKVTLSARPSLIPFLITRSAPPSFAIPHPPTRPPTIPTPHP
ncbi:MAG TPA: trypsin-like peptidase domain-containing protein [Candidatus Bathyarchaeia archaeon]|nr:trypsin-like peptidase domain-containing protein [Candidatus Bathyarchaeia archaeon]